MSAARSIEDRFSRASSSAYWAELAAGEPRPPKARGADSGPSPAALAALRASLFDEGYCVSDKVLPPALVGRSRSAVERVVGAGWLPAFAFLFDEPWLLLKAAATRAYLGAALGEDYLQMPDIFAFFVGRGADHHGYRPHREVGRGGLLLDGGAPKALTLWIPLTDATLDNGCMYVVPGHLELERWSEERLRRNYAAGDGKIAQDLAYLHRAQALPAPAGAFLSWHHELIHWGSFSSRRAAAPRLAVSFELMRAGLDPAFHPHLTRRPRDLPDLEFPPCRRADDPLPAFAQRLYYVAFGIYRYHEGATDDPAFVWARAVLERGFPTVTGA